MPIYEYICQDCQGEFELMRSFKESDSAATCTHCQSQSTKRKLSLFNASSSSQTITRTGGCGGCAGGSCSSCGPH